MKMQHVRQLRQLVEQGLMARVFAVSQQRAAHFERMDADLVRAAGLRPEGDPGELVHGRLHHPVIGQSCFSLITGDAAHLFLALRACLGQHGFYLSFAQRRRRHRNPPVIFANTAPLKHFPQTLRHLRVAGKQQDA
jgi:hypothetical protein